MAEPMKMPGHTTVCVIGAGLAGLALCRALQERNVDFLCMEATDNIGGLTATSGVSTTDPSDTRFQLVPFHADELRLPESSILQRYCRGYVKLCGFGDRIWLNAQAVSVQSLPKGGLTITLDDGSALHAHHVGIATGFAEVAPRERTGSSTFSGRQLTSQAVLDPATLVSLEHDRILVIGDGPLGVTAAIHLARNLSRAHILHAAETPRTHKLHRGEPRCRADAQLYRDLVRLGRIHPRASFEAAHGQKVRLGRSLVETVDTIVWAREPQRRWAGNLVGAGLAQNPEAALWKHVLDPAEPRIAHIGRVQTDSRFTAVVEAQARLAADLFAGITSLHDTDRLDRQRVTAHEAARARWPGKPHRLQQIDPANYIRQLHTVGRRAPLQRWFQPSPKAEASQERRHTVAF